MLRLVLLNWTALYSDIRVQFQFKSGPGCWSVMTANLLTRRHSVPRSIQVARCFASVATILKLMSWLPSLATRDKMTYLCSFAIEYHSIYCMYYVCFQGRTRQHAMYGATAYWCGKCFLSGQYPIRVWRMHRPGIRSMMVSRQIISSWVTDDVDYRMRHWSVEVVKMIIIPLLFRLFVSFFGSWVIYVFISCRSVTYVVHDL